MIEVRPRRFAAACALSALVAGCGSTPSDHHLTSRDATALHEDLALVRAAAASHDPAKATQALNRFASLVHQRAIAGDFSSAQSSAFRRLIADTRARVASEVTVPVVVTAPAPVQAAPVVHEKKHPHPPKHPGHGRKHGKAKDD